MHPFINLFGRAFPVYGLMMILAAFTAFVLLALKTRNRPTRADIFNFFFFAIVGGLAGGILLYAVVNLPGLIRNWAEFIAPLPFTGAVRALAEYFSGIVFYGGVIGGIAGMLFYSRKFKVPFLPHADEMAPVFPIAHAIGRIGCFLGGCCYGSPVSPDNPIAVVYPEASLGAPPGVPLLPVQLIEAGLNLLIALFIFVYGKKSRRPGEATGLYLALYAIVRFTLEFFRGDLVRGVYFGFSTSQIISLAMFVAGLVLLMGARKAKTPQL